MKRTRGRILLYAALIGVALVLMFPFYWVLVSSVKSRECISMTPPAFYPCRMRTQAVPVASAGRVVAARGETWLRLAASENILEKCGEKGGYYVRLDHSKPTQLVVWWPDDAVTFMAAPDENVMFENAQVCRLNDRGRTVTVLAKMVRRRAEPNEFGQLYDELLFAAPAVAARTAECEVLVNVRYTVLREFYARWENYPETLRGPEASYGQKSAGFLLYLRNSFFISIMAVIGQVFASSLVAYGFARVKFKGRNFLFILVLSSMMIPAQVTLIPLFSIYKSLGWIDTFLPLIVPHFFGSAFFIFLMRQYMLTIPIALDESAAIDGCGPLRTYFHIILPNCVPVLILVGLFTFVGTWQDIMGPLIYLDNPALRTVTLGLEYFRSPYVDNRHLLMTGAVLTMLPVAVIFLIFQRYIMAGIATTGIKA